MNPVKSYFDKVSTGYARASERLLWKKIRTNEAAAVADMLPRIGPATAALDLGSGSGYYTNLLHSHRIMHITCIDFSEKMLSQIENPAFVKIVADIEDYRSNEKFDVVLCAGALEFTNFPQKVFANVSTMLKPGGSFILLCPSKNLAGRIYRLYHKSHSVAVRLYDREELAELATEAGLKMQRMADVFPFSIVAKFSNA